MKRCAKGRIFAAILLLLYLRQIAACGGRDFYESPKAKNPASTPMPDSSWFCHWHANTPTAQRNIDKSSPTKADTHKGTASDRPTSRSK